jgi:hypothetical protein
MDWLVGGWQTSIIAMLQSGTPVDLSTGEDAPGNRPDLVGKISYPKATGGNAGEYWFNPTAFANPRVVSSAACNCTVYTRLGTLGRNQIFVPGVRTVNFSLQKTLALAEGYALELHGDAFNLLNTPAFTNPNGSMTSSHFVQIEGTQVYTNRQIQLAARFVF